MSSSSTSNIDLLAPPLPRRRNRSNASASQRPGPDNATIRNILAASPDWHYEGPISPAEEAGPSQAAYTGQLGGGQAANAGGDQASAAIDAGIAASNAPLFNVNNAPHGNPSPPTTPTRVPTIIITTPNQHLHLPESPILTFPAFAPHQEVRRPELERRIIELEQKIRKLEEEAASQETVTDMVWEELAVARGDVQKLKQKVEEGAVLVEGLKDMVGGLEEEGREWKGRAEVAEGLLGALGAYGEGEGEKEGVGEVGEEKEGGGEEEDWEEEDEVDEDAEEDEGGEGEE